MIFGNSDYDKCVFSGWINGILQKKLDKYNNVFAILYENRICSRGFSKFTLNKEVFLGYLKGIKYLVYSDKSQERS